MTSSAILPSRMRREGPIPLLPSGETSFAATGARPNTARHSTARFAPRMHSSTASLWTGPASSGCQITSVWRLSEEECQAPSFNVRQTVTPPYCGCQYHNTRYCDQLFTTRALTQKCPCYRPMTQKTLRQALSRIWGATVLKPGATVGRI
jgi:hypothetical protein